MPELQHVVDTRRGMSVLWQMDHLGEPIPDSRHAIIQWRLLFPLLGHGMALPPLAFFALAPLGNFMVLLTLIAQLRRRGIGWCDAGLGTVVLGAGAWFFTSNGWLGYFDSWVVLALLGVVLARLPVVVWIACLLAPWIDERFVMAMPLALTCRWLYRRIDVDSSLAAYSVSREFIVPSALILAFVTTRLGLLPFFSATDATPSGYWTKQDGLPTSVGHILLGLWEGLRMGWFYVGWAIFLSWRYRSHLVLLVAGVGATALIGLCTAQDYGRSMVILWPVAIYGLIRFVEAGAMMNRRILQLCAIGTLLLPAHHAMNDQVVAIYSFYHRLALLRIPLGAVSADYWEFSAYRSVERGNLPDAERNLTIAIKLSDNPGSLYIRLGKLQAARGRWIEARQSYTVMTEREPLNFEIWFLRAQSELAVGDVVAAQASMKQSCALAPADFGRRVEVATLLALLDQPVRQANSSRAAEAPPLQ